MAERGKPGHVGGVEQVTRRAFELDAARTDLDLGIGSTWHGMETTSFDGTTAATLAARAAALAGIDPDEISFTAVLGLVRAHVHADTRCRGRRPDDPLDRLLAGVVACPGNRTDRKRTSGCTPVERGTRHTEEAIYTIKITPSNLPKWAQSLGKAVGPVIGLYRGRPRRLAVDHPDRLLPHLVGHAGQAGDVWIPRRTAPPGPAAGWLGGFWPGTLRARVEPNVRTARSRNG